MSHIFEVHKLLTLLFQLGSLGRILENGRERIYYWLAGFHVAGIGLTPREICRAAEEALGEPFSHEILEEKIEEMSGKVSREEREKLVRLFHKFLQTWHDKDL